MADLFPPSERQKVEKSLQGVDQALVEAELRFLQAPPSLAVGQPNYAPGVTAKVFDLIRFSIGSAGFRVTEFDEETVYLESAGFRRRIFEPPLPEPEGWVRKTLLYDSRWRFKGQRSEGQLFAEDHLFALVVSREEPGAPPRGVAPALRHRKRYSAHLGSDLRLDLTISTDPEGRAPPQYEAEIEGRAGAEGWLDALINAGIQLRWERILRSELYYLAPQQRDVLNALNRLLNSRLGKTVPYFNVPMVSRGFLSEVEDLTFEDLHWGRLAGGWPGYYATPKANGVRFLLLRYHGQLWLFSPPVGPLNLLYAPPAISDEMAREPTIVLDGELMDPGLPGEPGKVWLPLEDAPRHYFYAFDILADEEGVAVQDCNAFERLEALQRVTPRFAVRDESGTRPVAVRTKYWVSLREDDFSTNNMGQARPGFFELMAKNVLNMAVSEYDTDGWVFTPILVPYTPAIPTSAARSRCARAVAAGILPNEFPKTFKYKPRERMTIDLFFAAAPLKVEMGVGQEGRVATTEFQRARIADIADVAQLTPGIIYEFALDGDGPALPDGSHELRRDPDGKFRLVLRMVRPRPEKPVPNALRTVKRVIKLWLEPITRAAITGQSTELLVKYHNRVKLHLYEAALIRVSAWLGGKPRLLDVGAGRGGDIEKWGRRTAAGTIEGAFGHVTAVEPNPGFAAELRQRAAASGWLREGDNFEVAQAPFLEAELPEGSFDVVSAMFSLTYFAADFPAFAEKVRRLASPEGCVFIFATLDGDQVDDLFARPPTWSAGHVRGTTLTLDGTLGPGDTWLRDLGPAEVEIFIPGSTANPEGKPRSEGKPRVSALIQALRPASHFTRVANEERLLGTFEALLGQCYAYGLAELRREAEQPLASAALAAEDQPRLSVGRRKAAALPEGEAAALPEGEAAALPELAGMRATSKVLPRPKSLVAPAVQRLTAAPPLVPLLLALGEGRGEARREIPIEEGEVLPATAPAPCSRKPCPPGLVRVGAAGGPNCMIHALLLATNRPYEATRSEEARDEMARGLRKLLARFLRLRFAEPAFAVFDYAGRGVLRRLADEFGGRILGAFDVSSMLADQQQKELRNSFRGLATANPLRDLLEAMRAEGRGRLADPAEDFAAFTADLQRLSAEPVPGTQAPEVDPAFASFVGYVRGEPSILQFYGVPRNYGRLLAEVSLAQNLSKGGVISLLDAQLHLPAFLLHPLCQLLALNVVVVTEQDGAFREEERVEPFPGMDLPAAVLLRRGECFEPLGLRDEASGLVITAFRRRLPEIMHLMGL
jgi:SAM-dependent methyltransferase